MKANWQKKYAHFWTTFFLSILEPSASAFAVVGFTWMKKKIIGCDKYFKVKHSVFYT